MTGKASSTSIHSGDQLDKLSMDPAEETLASEPAETHEAAGPPGQSRDDQETLLERETPDPVVVSLEPAMLRLETEPSGSSRPAMAVASSPQARLYKAALYAEQTKFGKPKNEYQMTLAEVQADWVPEDWDLLGIAPTVEEDKALSAVQILLDRTGYKGNLPQEKGISSIGLQWSGDLPRMVFTWPEYLEAYGLKRNQKGDFPRHQETRAKEALYSLKEPRRLLYKRTRYVNGQRRHDVIATEMPLIFLYEGYLDLTDSELAEVQAGARPERTNRIVLQPSPLLVDCLETFHIYKPANLHQQIEDLIACKKGKQTRPTRSHSLFIQLLHTVDFAEFKVSRDRLVDTLRLSKYREQRKLKQAYRQIDECLEIAQELGYVLSYKEDALGMVTMQLNPEKLSRVKAKQERLLEREAAGRPSKRASGQVA